jgi:TRAP-type C4-dicarboxylate transport system substrate-binding protein
LTLPIRIGGYQPLTSTLSQSCQAFADGLRRRLGDGVEIEFRNDIVAEGFEPNQMIELVASGELTMGYLAASYFADLLPESRVFDVPFAVESRTQAYRFLDGGYGERQRELLAANSNLRLLGIWDYGFRHITNARGPIRTPTDCADMRLRILLNDLHPRIFQTLGFETLSAQVPEFLARLRAGEDIAQENALTNFYNFGMQEFHRHVSLTGHLLGLANFVCTKSAYEGWPDAVQAAVTEAAAEATNAQRKIAADDEAAILETLKSDGCDIIELTAIERQSFVAALSDLMGEYRELIGPHLFAELDSH